ncbi:TetR family transcriptional regulator [Mycobacteroides immunogenum]|uniref:TetR family transcriptional regulator n=2 Tax=Mycobacteroides immunogenum TaxID=83262 RepID=A0A7V8LMX3_9MYCO|nr:TetR family transcriptional regulator [Mycobacteroides immunogenum]ANO07240.1 TetR family transcriptional regulator [Mycobacteroides immunogenum]KPG06614.1 TetR family transcriptional regulator [Mycobacteroides immunogenum]KPG08406.1 TetR family transcriptional regulator [Mycobacteroides immunogenum]KPG11199.1 TetR family transcriptional regulator [Mycobacteroides immunogenum]
MSSSVRRKSEGADRAVTRNPRVDLVSAAVRLLNEQGPDALQTRKIAAAAGTSTMAVYTYFGGMRELIAEVAEEGLRQFADAQAAVAQTDDVIADFMLTGMAYRQFAIDYPHMYRLMFGTTSAHGVNAPRKNMFDTSHLTPEHPSAAYLFRSVQRAMAAGRIDGSPDDAAKVAATAAKFWTVMHGFVMLELAGFWGDDGAAVGPVLGSMTTDLLIALGDTPERVSGSAAAAAARIAASI